MKYEEGFLVHTERFLCKSPPLIIPLTKNYVKFFCQFSKIVASKFLQNFCKFSKIVASKFLQNFLSTYFSKWISSYFSRIPHVFICLKFPSNFYTPIFYFLIFFFEVSQTFFHSLNCISLKLRPYYLTILFLQNCPIIYYFAGSS